MSNHRMRVSPMRVVVVLEIWSKLRLDDRYCMLVVRSAFYLGYGLLACEDLVTSRDNAGRIDVIRTAMWLGMNDEDVVTLREIKR